MDHYYIASDWQPHNLNVEHILISAATLYNKKGKMTCPKFHEKTKSIFLDSGGYSFIKTYNEYPISISDYIDLAHSITEYAPLNHVATMDYFGSLELTIKLSLQCIEKDNSISWSPVIQGSTPYEYLNCLEAYQDKGIKANLWSVGGLKGQSISFIRKVLVNINKRVPKLHAFGLTLQQINDPIIWHNCHSADSTAWQFSYHSSGIYSGRPRTTKEKYKNLNLFIKRLEAIFHNHQAQTKLNTE